MVRFSLILAAALFLFASQSYAAECLLCHGAMTGKMKGRKGIVDVHVDGEKFVDSVHGTLACTDCHMGYASGPHSASADVPDMFAEMAQKISGKSTVDPVSQSACSGCHPEEYEAYLGSVHGQNIVAKKQVDGPLCIDCHGSPHYIQSGINESSAVHFSNIVHTCGNCHEDEHVIEKYGLSEHVIEKYKESFHGKKYILGHTKVPVCDDCHGGHAITRWDSPDSPVSGEGKVRTCGKCHTGATAKFAAAPAHKYIGKANPIPYYSAKGLTLLVIGTFGFIFSHVVLDMFNDIRRKLLSGKKGGSHD